MGEPFALGAVKVTDALGVPGGAVVDDPEALFDFETAKPEPRGRR